MQFFYPLETILDTLNHQKEKLQVIEPMASHVVTVVRVATTSNAAIKLLVTQKVGIKKKPRKKINHDIAATTEDDDSSISHPAIAHVALSGNSGMSSTCLTMNST